MAETEREDGTDPLAILNSTIAGDAIGPADLEESTFTAPGSLTIYDTPDEAAAESPDHDGAHSGPDGWSIPDFKADAEVFTVYDGMKAEFRRRGIEDVEERVRAEFAQKREIIRSEIVLYTDREEQAKTKYDLQLEQYGKLYPRCVDRRGRPRPLPPSFWTNLFSFWGAQKVYEAVQAAHEAIEEAGRARRKREDDEEKLDNDVDRAVQHAVSQARKEQVDPESSETFLKRPEVVEIRKRMDEIRAERAAFAQRLAAGEVSDLEMRARGMAEKGWQWAEMPFGSTVIPRIVVFGKLAYYVFRDEERAERLVPYDRRLEPLTNFVFDVYRIGPRFEARILRNPSRVPLNPLEHYVKLHDEPDEARKAYRSDRVALRADRSMLEDAPVEPDQQQMMDVLAHLAHAVDKEIANVRHDEGP